MVSKQTVNELLAIFLKEKGFNKEMIEDVEYNLERDVRKIKNKAEKQKKAKDKKIKEFEKKERARERVEEKEYEKSNISHGTSCPRIMIGNDLLIEM